MMWVNFDGIGSVSGVLVFGMFSGVGVVKIFGVVNWVKMVK